MYFMSDLICDLMECIVMDFFLGSDGFFIFYQWLCIGYSFFLFQFDIEIGMFYFLQCVFSFRVMLIIFYIFKVFIVFIMNILFVFYDVLLE